MYLAPSTELLIRAQTQTSLHRAWRIGFRSFATSSWKSPGGALGKVLGPLFSALGAVLPLCSNFRSNVQNLEKRLKFKKIGHPRNSVAAGMSGRTFEFPVERSKSGKTLKLNKNGTSEKFVHNPKNHITQYKIIKINIKSYEKHS